MQVKRKLFPYPILNSNHNLSNFENSNFELLYEAKENNYEYILAAARFSSNSNLLNQLFDEGKINVVLIIECSNTVFRKSVELNKEGRNIRLPKNDFSEKVDISMFAYAKTDLTLQSDEYDVDYQGIVFEIEKYDILAANDGFNIRFKHDETESSFVQSIFSITVDHELEDGLYIVDCNIGRKIAISLSEKDYNNYKIIYTVETYKEVFFNMLLIPALIESLSLCMIIVSDESKDLDDVGNQFTWFRSILTAYKKLKGNDLTIEEFKKASPVMLAQVLLGKPIGESLKKLVREINKVDEGEL